LLVWLFRLRTPAAFDSYHQFALTDAIHRTPTSPASLLRDIHMVQPIIFIVILICSLGFFIYSSLQRIKALKIARTDDRFDNAGARIKNVLVVALAQSKLLREPLAGLMHFFIFWGFVVLLSAVLEAILQGVLPDFSLKVLGPLFPLLAFLQECIGILVIVAVLVGLVRWYFMPPKRYFGREISGHVRLDATVILLLIMVIVLSMFGTTATHMVLAGDGSEARFVSVQLAGVFEGAPGLEVWYSLFWWTHIILVLGFLNYLPYSKHLHVLTSIPNVYFASLKPRGELAKLDLEDENAEKFGAEDVSDLTWKQLLDGYTCTDCGRCTSVCPANITGKLLSPRKIIMNIRQRTAELAPIILAGTQEQNEEVVQRKLLGNYVADEELWACTSCRACMEECPVMIEHVPAIMDMRRYLVLTESRFPSELTTTFKNLETNFSPWAFSHDSRADWAEDLGVKTMAEATDGVDVLYWVGCAGSYDQRYIKVSRAMVKLLNTAGINFAILGTEEKCNGDPARRSGNEYLAQMLIAENVETLNRYRFKKIITTCPHCFNTLKNEYPQFGGNFEVVHHTEYLNELVTTGRLKPLGKMREKTTFHDSCYIGRYNSIYDAPRQVLQSSGASLIEMPRARDKGFCCGAGGARMFMEETVGKRVNIERTEEALRVAPETIATSCPFCMTMLGDGLKDKNAEESVKVKDIAEVLAEAIA
jgi:Fe-S oxidoreductase